MFDWEAHVERLANSSRLMLSSGVLATCAAAIVASDAQLLRPVLEQHVSFSMRHFVDACVADGVDKEVAELRITVLIHWPQPDAATPPPVDPSQQVCVVTHIAPMPPRPAETVKCLVIHHPRASAAAKDSGWVAARLGMKARVAEAGANEAVLAGDDGKLHEGLSSNFFAVKDGTVYTAPLGDVLSGTIRTLTIDLCHKHGIPVMETNISVSELGTLQEAFITSTSRVVLPIGTLEVDEMLDCPAATISLPSSALARRLDTLALEEMRARCTELI